MQKKKNRVIAGGYESSIMSTMFESILNKVFGSHNERELKRIGLIVEQINSLEPEISSLSDDDLSGKTKFFKERLVAGETVDDILPEAFAVCREAGKRVLSMRHFDVQLIGGVVLHEGRIAEMKTGEGKTLVATLPTYLNALTGKGVHLITVNDYLAKRDAEWMGRIYRFLGLSIGIIQHDMDEDDRQAAYGADITYGTNNEFGFDYLRDNMKFHKENCVQRELHFALVDEVDSILIDESRTPLIISGPAEDSTDKYVKVNSKIKTVLVKDEFYTLDEKTKSVSFTEEGVSKAEEVYGVENLYDPNNIELLHHITQALKAHTIFAKDVDYVVKDNQVLIVDEFTGRLMPGRRYSDGLHQALEAKEGAKIENENQTLASITFQNYFRMYDKLAGMTGTADTEAVEFENIYKLQVIIIPTNQPNIRNDRPDLIYRTEEEKHEAIADEIEETHKTGQPMLVGTISIERSELISRMLEKRGVPHHVLNAKKHESEAAIVAQAGSKGAVTIATNMAGRGTDIVLGGNPERLAEAEGYSAAENAEEYDARVAELTEELEGAAAEVKAVGGLKILGTERHESRRIDNQLRGRSGRQGDEGESIFYLSLEDDLMRIFGSDRLSNLMEKLGMEKGVPIEHKMVTKAIENAQKRVEGHNFDMRKHLLEYDDVMNKQREIIYSQRKMIMEEGDIRQEVIDFAKDVVAVIVNEDCPQNAHPDDWNTEMLAKRLSDQFLLRVSVGEDRGLKVGDKELSFDTMVSEDVVEAVEAEVEYRYSKQEQDIGADRFHSFERYMLLQVLDNLWKDHLLTMDHLKEGINFRSFAQKNPLNEYKREGFDLFEEMIGRFKQEITSVLTRVRIEEEQDVAHLERKEQETVEHRGEEEEQEQEVEHTPVKNLEEKVGRNDPCPCGSGKKFKKCHGKG